LYLTLSAPFHAAIRLSPRKPLIVDAPVGEAWLVVVAERPHRIAQASLTGLGQSAFLERAVVARQQFAGTNRSAVVTVGMTV
jgi:hypothetical protein